jgi:hypothetical protein
VQRSIAYGDVSHQRQIVSFDAQELAPVVQTAAPNGWSRLNSTRPNSAGRQCESG